LIGVLLAVVYLKPLIERMREKRKLASELDGKLTAYWKRFRCVCVCERERERKRERERLWVCGCVRL